MSFFRLKHLFAGLMTLSAACAFVVPARILQGRVPAIDLLFAPVSKPSGAIAGWAHGSVAAPELSADTREADVVKRENESLKDEVMSLRARLDALEAQEADEKQIGDIRRFCTRFSVTSSDAGTHASLGILGSSWQGLHDGMIALYPGGIVGRVERSGIAGARIQLITDTGFRVDVGFVRFDGAAFVRLKPAQTYAEGTGRGAMRIIGLTKDAASGLKKGDWCILNDHDWPANLQGRALGRIGSIGPRSDAPLTFTQIIVEPTQNLLRLSKVLIITKQSSME
jgi:cell shape-determining protein MreC